jgi:hypothetical protein
MTMVLDRAGLARSLSAIIDETDSMSELPQRLCAACLDALPVKGVGLSLMGGHHLGGRALLGASDATGARLEQLQFDLGEGPCATAFGKGQPVLVPDLAASEAGTRWPMFTHELQDSPARALFAFPLQLGAIRIGAMDCYRTEAGSFEAVTEALVVAEAITLTLLQAQHREATSGTEDSGMVATAVGHHAEVHQATGMVSAQLNISTDEAFVRLQAYAYRQGRSLDEIGADLVARRLTFPGDPP